VQKPGGKGPDTEVSDAEEGDATPAPARRRLPSTAALLAIVVGLSVSAALAVVALELYNHNEKRLVNLRVRELALVIASTEPAVQTPLSSAAELASATNGDPGRFRQLVAEEIGQGRQFRSMTLWRVGESRPAPAAIAGSTPAILSRPAAVAALFSRGTPPGRMRVVGLLDTPHPALGFALTSTGPGPRFVVYAESQLPANRRSTLESNNAFSDLNYVLYLGRSRSRTDLLVTSAVHLPLTGRTAAAKVPYGESVFTLVVAARGSLGGRFFRDLPIIIGIAGAILTLAAAVLFESLVRRRRAAEGLADTLDRVAAENRRLYVEQRGIAETLQHALLPETLPEMGGLRVAARYVPASQAGHVGGDWYDVVPLEDGRVGIVIGDVSGHGIEAATTMALVRHAALAYIVQDPRPATVLAKLARFVNARPHAYFATVLCVLVDVKDHRLTAASAGHLPPLVVQNGDTSYLSVQTGPPVGVAGHDEFRESSAVVQNGAALVAFTDGLVERRGEVLDIGLERLRRAVARERLGVDVLLTRLEREFTSDEHGDDTAMVAVQWQT
jgi:serine phosphatase RsbU (regulator of sigma subunit)